MADDSTLLYAPEVKFYSLKLKVDQQMRTSIPFIYAIGDGAGISRGIVGAAVTGLIGCRKHSRWWLMFYDIREIEVSSFTISLEDGVVEKPKL